MITGRAHVRSVSAGAAFATVVMVGLLAAAAAQAKIVVGQGMAGVRLGMTMAQVEKTLGKPTAKQSPDYKGDVEWNYAKAPLMGALSFDKSGKLLGVWTSAKTQKTNKGIGPGSMLAAVKKAYPTVKCSTGPFGPQSLICVLKSKDRGRTVETSFPFFTRTAGMREVDIDFVLRPG